MQEKIAFKNRQQQTLAGVLHRPDNGSIRACAIFAHCFTCTKNSKAAARISEALTAHGIGVLRFDFTGLGQSDGDFSETHFSSNVDDLIDAATYMNSIDLPATLLVGHSLGGTAVLAAAHEIDSVLAVATIGAPADAEHVLQLMGGNLEEIESSGKATVQLGGRPFDIRKGFVDDVRMQTVCQNLGTLRKALLVMHSPVDETVGIDQAAHIYTQAKHPKSFISLQDADHLLTRDRDSSYVAQMLAAWADRYIDRQSASESSARHLPGATVVSGKTADGFRVSVNADGHLSTADEPASLGGTGLGPTPYDLLGSALATCTVMTMNFFARREKLPLEHVEVAVTHDRIHATDCEDCKKTDGQIDRFQREISIQGDLDDEQRALLMKIADRCPVHRTLENEITIASRLV